MLQNTHEKKTSMPECQAPAVDVVASEYCSFEVISPSLMMKDRSLCTHQVDLTLFQWHRCLDQMSRTGFFEQRFGRGEGVTKLPAEYIQERMEDDDLNSAIVSPPLKYVARINSFATSETNKELER